MKWQILTLLFFVMTTASSGCAIAERKACADAALSGDNTLCEMLVEKRELREEDRRWERKRKEEMEEAAGRYCGALKQTYFCSGRGVITSCSCQSVRDIEDVIR